MRQRYRGVDTHIQERETAACVGVQEQSDIGLLEQKASARRV
jgi:hypothetical protein